MLYVMLMVMVLKVFTYISRNESNMLLGMIKALLEMAFAHSPGPIAQLHNYPADIRTVEACLNLDSKYTLYAACPQCGCLHEPIQYSDNPDVITFPTHCMFQPFPGSSVSRNEAYGMKRASTYQSDPTMYRIMKHF